MSVLTMIWTQQQPPGRPAPPTAPGRPRPPGAARSGQGRQSGAM